MRLQFSFLYLSIILLSFSACSVNKDSFNEKNNKLLIFPGYANIKVIEKGDKTIRSESLSQQAEDEMQDQLAQHLPSTIETKYLHYDEGITKEVVISNMQLVKKIRRSLFNKKPKAPELLLNILDSLGENYGLTRWRS